MDKFKVITLVLGIMLFISNGNAQEQNADSSGWDNLSYGIKVGAAISAFTHDFEPFTDKKTGLIAGFFTEYHFLDFLGVSIEPVYIQKGALNVEPDFLYDDPNIYDPYTIIQVSKVNTHQVQIPLIINLRMPNKSCCAEPFLSLGAAASYTLNVTAHNLIDYGTLNGQKYYKTVREGVTKQFEDWNFQLLIGPGVEFDNSMGNIILNVQYNIGLSKINKYTYQNQLYNFSGNSLLLTVGFRLK